MPGFDRTGPTGEGAMTGGGRGECVTGEPETVGRFVRRGVGAGRGFRARMFGRRGAGRGLGRGAGRGWFR